jgi:chromosomal replication initiation ATPase DnaA
MEMFFVTANRNSVYGPFPLDRAVVYKKSIPNAKLVKIFTGNVAPVVTLPEVITESHDVKRLFVKKPNVYNISRAVAGFYGKSVADIIDRSRTEDICRVRHALFFILMDVYKIKASTIAVLFKRDRTTITAAINGTINKMQDDGFASEIHRLKEHLKTVIDI